MFSLVNHVKTDPLITDTVGKVVGKSSIVEDAAKLLYMDT